MSTESLEQRKSSFLNVLIIAGVKPYQQKFNEKYMSMQQLLHFKCILTAWKDQLKKDIEYSALRMQNEVSINFPDPVDRATQEEEFNIELRNRDRERKLIKKIEETLKKIDIKEFGFCALCEIEIGIRRLEANPIATLCIDCKTLEEIKEKQMTGNKNMERVWIGIGSNLLNPEKQVNRSIWALSNLPKTSFVVCSTYYRSRPMGIQNQPDFLNAVIVLDTNLNPEELLFYTQHIEHQQGRIRDSFCRWRARTLDLDILLFGKYIIHTIKLIIPHYDMRNRAFVMYPLIELNQNLLLPNEIRIKDVIKTISTEGLSFWKMSNCKNNITDSVNEIV